MESPVMRYHHQTPYLCYPQRTHPSAGVPVSWCYPQMYSYTLLEHCLCYYMYYYTLSVLLSVLVCSVLLYLAKQCASSCMLWISVPLDILPTGLRTSANRS